MSTSDEPSALARWPLKSEQDLGDHSIFTLTRSVRRSPRRGLDHTFTRLDAPDWVNVVAVREDGQLLLIEQYRHGTDAITLEIPGGTVDGGETPAQAAARELEEETGYFPAEILLLGQVEPNPAFLSNTCWTFLALGCTHRGRAEPDVSEEIELRLSTISGFSDLIHQGAIRHALVIAAHDHLQRALARREPSVSTLQ